MIMKTNNMLKKGISLALSTTMVISTFGTVFASSNNLSEKHSVQQNIRLIETYKNSKKYEVISPDGELQQIIQTTNNDESISYEVITDGVSMFVHKENEVIKVYDESHNVVEEINIGASPDLSLNMSQQDLSLKSTASFPSSWSLQSSSQGSRSGDLTNFGVLLTIISLLIPGPITTATTVAYTIYGAVAKNFYYKRKVYFRTTGPKSWEHKYVIQMYKHSNYTGYISTGTNIEKGYGY